MEKTKKKKRAVIFIIAGIIIAVIILVIILSASGKNRQWQWVETAVVDTTDISRELTANGEIGSRESETLTARVSGTVKTLFLETGDKVEKDTLIGLFDDETLNTRKQSAVIALENTRRSIKEQLLALRTAYTQAKTAYEQAKRNYDNITQSHGRGAVSDEQLTVAGDALAVAKENFETGRQKLNFREGRPVDDLRAKAFKDDEEIIREAGEVKEAGAALDAINKSLADCAIRAGIKGVITDLRVETGSMVTQGMVIGTVHNPALLEVTANIDEVDISYIRLNQQVRIESDAFIGTTLEGRVSYIAPVITRIGDSRVCTIKAELADPGKKAKIGASCSVFITAEKREKVMAIPIEAFLQEKDKKYVYKLAAPEIQSAKDNIIKTVKTEIETGLMGMEKVELLKGLAAGDKIVKNNLKNLKDGAKVKIKEEKPQK